MSEVAKKWYVVRAISGKEKRVKEYLEIEMGRMKSLDENIEQVLIPTEKIFQIRNGKKSK
jgi:transcriptional antiterminator NusG